MKYRLTAILLFLCLIPTLFCAAQTPMLSNQGTLISVKDGAFVAVHGDVQNENSGEFHNSDTIHLYGDWENNASNEGFISLGEGLVTMRGDSQEIKGSSITRFYTLQLENTGVKFAKAIDVYVDGWLRLNDREFDVDTNVVEVFNTDPTAVQTGLNGDFGFVSSMENGGLLRHVAQTAVYNFPVGSSRAAARFRPLDITPSASSAAAFCVRHANLDANQEGYDRNQKAVEICDINPNFYHRIARTQGNVAAQLDFYYAPTTDGNYNGLGHWDAAAWQEETRASSSANAQFGLDKLSSDSLVSTFSPFPFALVNVSPAISLTATPNPVCSNELITLDATGNYTTFDFFVDSIWVQSSGQYSYQTTLTSGQHLLWVVGTDGNCGRQSAPFTVTSLAAPQAQASADTIIVLGDAASISATGGDFYAWTPAADLDCDICNQTLASPQVSTNYIVTVENLEGCTDQDTVFVDVREEVEQLVFIPNVITPNNDGKNDSWRIQNIQLFPLNRVRIVNRWGDLVFKSENYSNNWNGTGFSGNKLPAGTYYYILDLGAGWGIFKGPITIIRK